MAGILYREALPQGATANFYRETLSCLTQRGVWRDMAAVRAPPR